MNKQMQKYREEINQLDSSLIKLLEKRFKIAKKIGKYKKKRGLPVRDAKREKEIIFKRKKQSKLNPYFIEKLFSLIFKESRDLQIKNREL